MGRRLTQLSLIEPYLEYLVEIDLEDGGVATISSSGARAWDEVPEGLRQGLIALVEQVVREMRTDSVRASL